MPSNLCVFPLGRPGIASPSMAVVRKRRLPQTIGEDRPRPGMGVFQAMFLVLLHSVGRFLSGATPVLCGPRHCGQLTVTLGSMAKRATGTSNRVTASLFMAPPYSRM